MIRLEYRMIDEGKERGVIADFKDLESINEEELIILLLDACHVWGFGENKVNEALKRIANSKKG